MTKIKRVQAVLEGKTPDKIPAGFWFHYPSTLSAKETAEEHLKLYRHTDQDIMKIMQDFMYPISGTITGASDWYKIKFESPSSAAFRKQAEVIKRILDDMGGEAYDYFLLGTL